MKNTHVIFLTIGAALFVVGIILKTEDPAVTLVSTGTFIFVITALSYLDNILTKRG